MLGHKRSKSLLCETGILTATSPWDADVQHRIQLETYHRDPKKAQAAKRLAEQASHTLKSPPLPSVIVSPATPGKEEDVDGKGRRRSIHLGKYQPHYLSLKLYTKQIRLAGLAVLVLICLACALRLSALIPQQRLPYEWERPIVRKSDPPAAAHSRVRLTHDDRTRAARLAKDNHMVKNGLLHVNMDSTIHPIKHLITTAKAKWEAKNAKQSKTLLQAVAEYKRRYKQAPPKGFDLWWKYAQKYNVALPDEYDQISRDMAPFRALTPSDLNDRLTAASQKQGTYTLRVTKGELSSFSPAGSNSALNGRLTGQMNLASAIAKYLPDMSMVYSIHDTPLNLISYGHRSDLMEAISGGEYISPADELDISMRGLSAACSSISPLRRGISNVASDKTFIADLSEYTDLCNNPSVFKLHGSLIGKDPAVGPLSPIFSMSKTSLHADVLGVPTEQWVDIKKVPAWEERTHDKLLWRGSNTGMHYSNKVDWRSSQRTRLVEMANSQTDERVSVMEFKNSDGSKYTPISMSDSMVARTRKDINENMDVAFTGQPIQCEEDVCPSLKEDYTWSATRMNHSEALDYKYVLDVDGNAWSARFERLLQSGSLVFKSTIMREAPFYSNCNLKQGTKLTWEKLNLIAEWFSDQIQPWVHFVPVQVDYSDLPDTLAFFRPTTSSEGTSIGGEDALASTIASAGREWAKSYWRREDMTSYTFRLYLEWARLVSPQRSQMDFVYSPDMEIMAPTSAQ